MDNEETLAALEDSVKKLFPKKTIVDISDYEDADSHQSYKYLYDMQSENIAKLNNELASCQNELSTKDRNIAELNDELTELKRKSNDLRKNIETVISMLKEFVDKEIVISHVVTSDSENENLCQIGTNSQIDTLSKTVSENPGIYGSKRPSFFTPLQNELSKKAVVSKTKSETIPVLKEKILFWKKHKASTPAEAEQIADLYDKKRFKNIMELLNSKCSNEEMYLKYMLLSPGLDRDYYKILEKAQSLGIDARLLIALLEQPGDYFNKDIIELYVTELHKGTEYDIKQALAEELIAGKWYVKAKMGDKEQKFTLVPVDVIKSIKDSVESIKDCANLAQNETNNVAGYEEDNKNEYSDSKMTQEIPNDLDEAMLNENTSVAIEFDDSKLF